jgi:two-component system C4-dicarboxylate transport sensor histidine kinase DctB
VRGVAVAREYAADLPPVPCQQTLLGQLLVNLIGNALDAVEGRPQPRVVVRVVHTGTAARIEIEDNGPGVPEGLRERIFDPFFSTKGDRGNGLGLWISSEIARLHGGSLGVESSAAGGAKFVLTLPLEGPDRVSDAA